MPMHARRPFVARVLDRLTGRRKRPIGPSRLLIDPTYKCNLSCIGCHSPQVAKFYKGETNLSVDEYRKVIDDFAACGGESVSIYGGEPLLVPEVFDIIAMARTAGLTVRLCTNALLLDERKATRLIELGIAALTISVDGVGDVYESIRGAKMFPKFVAGVGAWQRANAAAGAARVFQIFHVTVQRNNIGHLADVLSFGKEHGGDVVSYAYAARVDRDVDRQTEIALGASFRTEWSHWFLPAEIMVTEAQVLVLRQEARTLEAEAARLGITLWLDPALTDEAPGTRLPEGRFQLRKPCAITDQTMMLGPGGYATLCPMLTHHPVANVRETGVAAYWSSNEQVLKLRELLRRGEYLPICSQCTNHGDFM
jgi:MoaA/NifB/PqqE/SkfB family radical SAM enzyme